jgi:hypothetical protein
MKSPDHNPAPKPPSGNGIVCGKASSTGHREELESMARRRFQDPEPEVVGNWWQVRVYRDEYVNGRRVRKRKRIRLAPATMQVREVQ